MDFRLQRTLDEIQRVTSGMTPQQLAWHPEGKWSAAQILEHLSLTYTGTTKGMHRLMAGVPVSRRRTMRDRLFTFVVVGCGHMPSGRNAPEGVVPGAGDPANAIATIVRDLREMDSAISEAEAKAGACARLQHPVLGPLTLAQWRKFHWVHTVHHVRQIARLRQLHNAG